MQALGRQLVLIDSYDEGTQLHSTVGIDDQQGGYDATRLMLDNGHRIIALAASNITVDGAIHRRYKGYVKAMTEAGLDTESFIFQDALSFGGGYNIGKALLELSLIHISTEKLPYGASPFATDIHRGKVVCRG